MVRVERESHEGEGQYSAAINLSIGASDARKSFGVKCAFAGGKPLQSAGILRIAMSDYTGAARRKGCRVAAGDDLVTQRCEG